MNYNQNDTSSNNSSRSSTINNNGAELLFAFNPNDSTIMDCHIRGANHLGIGIFWMKYHDMVWWLALAPNDNIRAQPTTSQRTIVYHGTVHGIAVYGNN